MRDVFPGYYRPTDQELTELWETGLIVLDTNALFNLFRYTQATRANFLEVLTQKHQQLWIPHQVGKEFQVGRLGIIKAQGKAFEDLIEKTQKALTTVTQDVGALRNHPTLDLDDLKRTIVGAVAQVKEKIEATRNEYEVEVLDVSRHDETTDKIGDLYFNRVGKPYEDSELKELFEEGEIRYELKQPPGYKDAKKPAPEKFGDLILWLQILDEAEKQKLPVIFVGEDQKEDWWREFDGRKIGPRVELVDEFKSRVGKRIYFVTPPGLMKLAEEFGVTVSEAAVEEISEVSEEQSRNQEDDDANTHRRVLARNEFTKSISAHDEMLRHAEIVRIRWMEERLAEMQREGLSSTLEYQNLSLELWNLRSRHQSEDENVNEEADWAYEKLLRNDRMKWSASSRNEINRHSRLFHRWVEEGSED